MISLLMRYKHLSFLLIFKAFDDDDMLLFRNNGIIDIDNNEKID